MIRFRILPLMAAAALMGLHSCTTRPVQPQFGMIAVDTLVGDSTSRCEITYRFTTIQNSAESAALDAIEQANIGHFFELEEFTGAATEAIRAAVAETAAELLPGPLPLHAYTISVESEGSVVDTLLCYAITRSSYLGGAHGIYGTEYHTYSLADGFELATTDLFDRAQLQRLEALIRRKLCERYDAADDEGLSAAGLFPEYIGVTENFRISTEGITFCYNPYEIGCYALGGVEVHLSREELNAL